jgi:hypothetical protein
VKVLVIPVDHHSCDSEYQSFLVRVLRSLRSSYIRVPTQEEAKLGSQNNPVCLNYFSANEQCFSLTTNQHKHQHKPNFSISEHGDSQILNTTEQES